MPSRNFFISLCLFSSFALLVAGCGGEEDANPSNPGSTDDTLILDNSEAEEFTVSALNMVNEMVNSVPNLAGGDFQTWDMTKSSSDSLQWDPIEEAYIFTYEGPLFELEPPNSMTMRLGIWLQYRNSAGDPQQLPIGATEMELDYSTGMAMHMEEGQTVSEMDYDMASNLTVSYLDQGQSYGILGSGITTISVSQTTAQGSQSGQFAMDWDLDLTAVPGGCPSGTATISVQNYDLVATYDGLGGVTWDLTGSHYQASGSETLGCVAP